MMKPICGREYRNLKGTAGTRIVNKRYAIEKFNDIIKDLKGTQNVKRQ